MGYILETTASHGDYYLLTGSDFLAPFYDLDVHGVKPFIDGGQVAGEFLSFQ